MKKLILEAKPWLCFLFLMTSGVAMLDAQETFVLTGTVSDQNAELLPFVVVSDAENDATKTTTDFDGKFRLETSYALQSVKFQFGGVPTLELPADYNGMDVVMTFPELDSIKIVQGGRGVVSPFVIPPIRRVPLPVTRIVARRFMQNPLGSKVFPISELGAKEISSTNGFSMQDALNMIPGVQMDSRGYNGSRRLNLRGTISRSPFGVRNVRMTLNGFPLTSSDGSSALELIEPSEISLLSLHKGPSGSYEMTGTGGVLAASLLPVYGRKGRGEITLGEFGFFRAKAGINFGKNHWRSRVSLVHSFNDGYRDQEANEKTQLAIDSRYSPKNNHKLNYDLLFMLYDGYWELPGHITEEDAELDPTQADPESVEFNAHVKRRRAYIGLHQNYKINSRLSNSTRIFGQISDKYNPYGTNIDFQGLKDEYSNDLGIRTEFNWIALGDSWNPKLRLKTGTQWQVFNTEIDEFDNDEGAKGFLKYQNKTGITEGLVFLSADYNPFDKFRATAQLGYNTYSLNNQGVNSEQTQLDFKSGTQSAILPRIGASYDITKHGKLGVSYAQGLGYPSIFEWVDVETGLFSPSLKPEESSNLEITATHKVYKSKTETDLKISAYTGTVQNTIVENSNDTEAIYYTNEGESFQRGIEFQGSYTRLGNPDKTLGVFSTVAVQNYYFDDPLVDPSRLKVPGIPNVRAVLGVNSKVKNWDGNLTATYSGPIATEVSTNLNIDTEYYLVNAKLGRTLNTSQRWNYRIELGVNNLLNELYTSFYNLNAFGGRSFNPMPPRNFFVSFKVNFD